MMTPPSYLTGIQLEGEMKKNRELRETIVRLNTQIQNQNIEIDKLKKETKELKNGKA